MFSFGLSSVIVKVSYTDFEHAYIHWKKNRITVIVLVILKYLVPQTNTYSKPATETLKQYVKSVKS